MDLSDFNLVRVAPSTNLKPFDCGDSEINDFLLSESKFYNDQLLAVTHVIENAERTIAYFSIFNDSIKVEDLGEVSKTYAKTVVRNFVPFGKRHLKHFPAIKIGRLGVCKTTKEQGLGRKIISYIISLALEQNEKCACKFISVDAYAASLGFYEKLNFSYFTPADAGKETRQMFLDLTPFINTASEEQQP